MLRRLLMAAVTVMVAPLAAMLVPGAANAATAAACTGGVSVSQFAFSPASVPIGSGSNLTLVLQNCGSQPVQGSTSQHGTYDAQGCPVSDGPDVPFSIDSGGSLTLATRYGDGSSTTCAPTLLRVIVFVTVNGVGQVATATATLQFTSGCTSGVAIDQLSFSPGTVLAGQTSTLTLALRNCTSQAISGSTIWAAQFTGAGTVPPPGCPALDPTGLGYSLAPGGTATLTMAFGDTIPGCQATGMKATVNVNVNGVTGTVATATASLVITQPVSAGTCHVSYVPSNWPGGFTANVTIANTGATAINGWTLAFTFPGDQKITSPWNASVTQSGASVTATNLSYNATISPGGSQSFGFQGTWATSDASPASFSLNGLACT
jgi:hypothetical protein